MNRCWLVPILLTATGSGLCQTAPDQADAVRSQFLLAYTLVRVGATQSGGDSEALRNYVIYPYLEAARLGRDVSTAARGWSDEDNAVETFLMRHAGEPVSFNLRAAWLNSLGSRELWPEFLDQYRDEVADTALRCRYLAARIALGEIAGVAPLILDEWLTPYQLPPVCEPVFQWLRDAGMLDDDATEARARLLLQNEQAGFARVIARRLPQSRAGPLFAWADLIDRPLVAIEANLAMPSADIRAPMLLDGWSRLARDNPDSALALHDNLIATEAFDDDDAKPYTLALALGLAWDRRPQTLDFFDRAARGGLDDYSLGWQARAALWAGKMDVARRSIAAMSADLRATAEWRYWAARTAVDDEARKTLYRDLLPDDNYFAAVAAAQLRDRPEAHAETHERDPETITRLAAIPGMVRAGELWRVRLPVAAAREWRTAYADLDDAERDQSVHLASELGWLDLAIATATERGIFFDYPLLYPRPYAAEVRAAADEFDLKPALIYAVIRQESLYRRDAESPAGALGLMQLTRDTVADIARSLNAAAAIADPLDPGVNIRFGAARLARLLERYGGNVVVALAAYNAGPAAVDRWLPGEPVAADIWLENVPYNETREYVHRVLWNTVVFESLDGDRVNARDWLREVERP